MQEMKLQELKSKGPTDLIAFAESLEPWSDPRADHDAIAMLSALSV